MAYQPELEKLERRYQEDPGRNFAQLAESYRKLGRIDDALDVLRAHLADRPNYVSGLVVLGRCLLDQQNDAEARATFERVVAVDGEHIIALKALGEIAERAQELEPARRWYRRLLDIDPMNDDAAAALARLPAEGAVPTPTPVEAPAAPASETAPAVWAEPIAEAPAPPAEPAPAETVAAAWAEPAEVVEGAPEPGPAAEILHEEIIPGEDLEVRTAELAGDITIERASSEYLAEAADLEPVAVERTGEADVPLEPESTWGEEDFPQPLGDGIPETPPAVEAEVPDEEVTAGTGESPWFEAEEEPEAITLEAVEAPSGADELVIEAFDESLGWDAGERVSRQISSEDLAAAETLHEESLAIPAAEILGSEEAALPDADEVEVLGTVPVDGLEVVPAGATEVPPVEGFETHALVGLAAAPDEAEPKEPDLVAEVPLLVDAAEVEAQEAARQQADRRASLAGLPVFIPDEPAEPAAAPLVVDAEPEPVVTETMAELYARQGLVTEAQDVYRRLLEAKPGDARLSARLAELEAPARPLAQPTIRYLAAESGGQRVRDFLADLLTARAASAVSARAGAEADLEGSSGLGSLEAAFEEEPSELRGEPTQPAADEVSLAAIFGDAAPAAPPAGPSGAPDGEAGRPPGGFSFDDFFGKGGTPALPEQERAPRDTLADDEGDDAFRDWLKSLKS